MKIIAVIGLGSIGKRHADNLRGLGCHVWGFDPDLKKRLEIGYDFTSHNIKDLLNADAFVVSSPTDVHLEQFKYYLEDTKKPILMEKPIADEYAAEMKAVTMVGYNLRFHSCVKKAKEWLDAGLIGKPIWANFTLGQYNDRPPYLRDGVILNFASHEIDMAYHLLGKAKVLCATTQTVDGYEMMTDFVLEHESGCRSSNHTDYITIPEQRYFTITGDKGRIFVNVVDRIASLMVDSKWVDSFVGSDTWNENYISEMQAFLDRIDGKETLGATGEDGLHVLELCLDIKRLSGL